MMHNMKISQYLVYADPMLGSIICRHIAKTKTKTFNSCVCYLARKHIDASYTGSIKFKPDLTIIKQISKT